MNRLGRWPQLFIPLDVGEFKVFYAEKRADRERERERNDKEQS